MDARFSQKVKDILTYSKEEAIRLENESIGTEHLFLGLLRAATGSAIEIMEALGADLKRIRVDIESKILNQIGSSSEFRVENFPILGSAERVLKLVNLEARDANSKVANTLHLLLAILRDENSIVTETLRRYDITYQDVKDYGKDKTFEASNRREEEEDDDETFDDTHKPTSSKPNSSTPFLDNFGIDLTAAAEDKTLDPIVGRDVEIERLVQILSRRKKNNPILIGEPGVGKSAIAEGLALRIVNKKVSRVLFNKRLITLDLASMVAGTKYRGQFEERIKSLLNELSKNKDVILFIDEIHTMVGAGGASGSLDAANMLKPALARGEIQCIGATTLDEYRQYIEKDGALERRFQKIMVDPTTVDETMEILNNIKERYEDYHNVYYSKEAIAACAKLTDRYISDRHLPDKAIDALDEVGSRIHISNINVPERIDKIEKEIEEVKIKKVDAVKSQLFEEAANLRDEEQKLTQKLELEKKKWEENIMQNKVEVTEADVEKIVAMMTGIPIQKIALAEGARLKKMNDLIGSQIIGQDEAIKKVVRAIQRNRAGLKDPNKPIGTFIFLGPTGVGKTQLAKILSKHFFDGVDSLIRIDMSEYMEKFSVSRLVGAPPGYIGYEEGGQLTEKVRRKPYSVVLLDEIEKAHPDVFHLMLQVLDEGQLTDSLGRRIDFRNTIVIMTSNIGTRQIQDFGSGVGFASTKDVDKENKLVIQKALKRAFAPEFLNRIDDVILFNSLEREHMHKIIDIELEHLYKRVIEIGYKLELTEAAKDFIAEKGFDSKFGARPLKRAIQKYLEDGMAEVIIEASISEGDTVKVDLNDEKTDIKIEILKKEKPETN